MKRRLKIVLLSLGVLGGYGWGLASLGCHRERAQHRRAAFEQHVADLCVQAASRAHNAPAQEPSGGAR
ncbi:MAG: hypothetical protein MUF64_09170 [Polyangiaceae bacterium]|jgi:hypothetical protein|nr:hypothetical protein [Polyangiaceae bacterium]